MDTARKDCFDIEWNSIIWLIHSCFPCVLDDDGFMCAEFAQYTYSVYAFCSSEVEVCNKDDQMD